MLSSGHMVPDFIFWPKFCSCHSQFIPLAGLIFLTQECCFSFLSKTPFIDGFSYWDQELIFITRIFFLWHFYINWNCLAHKNPTLPVTNLLYLIWLLNNPPNILHEVIQNKYCHFKTNSEFYSELKFHYLLQYYGQQKLFK